MGYIWAGVPKRNKNCEKEEKEILQLQHLMYVLNNV